MNYSVHNLTFEQLQKINAFLEGNVPVEAPGTLKKEPEPPKERKREKKVVEEAPATKAPEPAKQEEPEIDPFAEEPALPPKTQDDVRALVTSWVKADKAARGAITRKRFGEITGLSSINEVNEKNGSQVFAKLQAELFKV